MDDALWTAYRRGEKIKTELPVRGEELRRLLLSAPAPDEGHQAALRLHGSTVEGPLDLTDATVDVPVTFDDCTFTDTPVLDGLTVPALRLTGCHLPGLHAERLQVARNLTLTGTTLTGAARLRDAVIGTGLDLDRVRVLRDVDVPLSPGDEMPPEHVAVDARGARIGGDLTAAGLTWRGALLLGLTRVEGMLSMPGATCGNGLLHAPSLAARGFYATDGFRLTGVLNLPAATIDGPLELPGAEVTELSAWGITVTGSVVLAQARVAEAVTLQGAELGAGLHATGLAAGRLQASRAEIRGDLVLADARFDGMVMMRGTRVGGTVVLRDAELGEHGGVSLKADGLVAFELLLECATPPGTVDLRHAVVELLADTTAAWPQRPLLTGFTYRQLRRDIAVGERLEVLRRATPTVEPQPYEQLAAAYRAAGRDRDARRVLHEKLRRESHGGGLPGRLWGLLQDLSLGYGYRPGRAAAIFAVLLLLGTVWFAATADCAGAAGLCAIKADEHPAWDPFLYTLDLLVPLVDLGHEKAWDPVGPDKVVSVALIVSGWIFASVVVAAAGRALSRS
ncbi:hypothetical protein JIG36_30005 [Actinoplanes sp. LDG1-06]|uniref:Membrane-associated oxidoreductase n=1 Tax=Paractinoplanes ovalisporus TaxID=2810368 RepID=A0ABS2AIV6_9ACTN|nr:hypothetical protein [Actinoplanes ovalisporus]MBM2619751.1 hypothetical protein [Actinoplanes ovalisporus]